MKEKVEKYWSKTKEWCKKHKKAIIIVGGTVVGIVIFKKGIKYGRALYLTDTATRVDEITKVFTDPSLVGTDIVSSDMIQAIDEDIFTDLAINIEDTVLSKAIEHTTIDKVYNLGDMIKKVTVNIDTV